MCNICFFKLLQVQFFFTKMISIEIFKNVMWTPSPHLHSPFEIFYLFLLRYFSISNIAQWNIIIIFFSCETLFFICSSNIWISHFSYMKLFPCISGSLFFYVLLFFCALIIFSPPQCVCPLCGPGDIIKFSGSKTESELHCTPTFLELFRQK